MSGKRSRRKLKQQAKAEMPAVLTENGPSKEFEERVSHNLWETNLDEVIGVIKEQSKDGDYTWSWARNMRCKYVSVWIDMRDGAFTLRDKDGIRISLEQLKYQYRSDDKKVKPETDEGMRDD